MRSNVSSGTRTYLIASSVWTLFVDLRTLGRIANPLQNRCFACIRSSDNEHSELDIWDSGGILLCSHSTKRSLEERLAKVMIRGWFPPLGLYIIILCRHQLTLTAVRKTSRIDPAYERVYSNPASSGVEVLCVIGTRTVEEHDGYRQYLARPA
jgi:hypothetical protein